MLPIEDVLPGLKEALRARPAAVLQAPPGAGKTTRVPLALLDEPWLGGQRILMLEPRRLAARAAANHMADLRGERVGQTVGYRVRMDTKVSRHTRVEVVTEGVLTRMLQRDPALDGVGLVIFDEFHERSLHADLGLALCLDMQGALREDLRLLVMSATLDGARVAALLGEAPVLSSEGRAFPVETHYLEQRPEGRMEPLVASTVRRALDEEPGDMLVFLPGAGEIRRVQKLLDGRVLEGVRVMPLYGNLPRAAQDEAIAPSPLGQRKVVLATSIAETSLTIEGVRAVIDSGWMRVPRFSPRSGMTRLETIRVSHASADQRRGRAGRLGPGVCYRLWTPHTQQHLAPHSPPEILEADLAPLALELASWGVRDPADLTWLDPPPKAAFDQARDLLTWLGALDARGVVTGHGREMGALGLHPRLAHMILRARAFGLAPLACRLAALLDERDILRAPDGLPDADLRLRLEALHDYEQRGKPPLARGYVVSRGVLDRVLKAAKHWQQRLGLSQEEARRHHIESAGLLLAFAYPDRIAQQRRGRPGRFRLRNGRAAAFDHPQLLSDAPFLVAAEVDGQQRESRIFQAAPISQEDLETHFAEQVEVEENITWDSEAQRVMARRRERLGALVLRDSPLLDPAPEAVAAALVAGILEEGLELLPWTKKARRLRERLAFLHRHDAAFPDVSETALLATLDAWLAPYLYGFRRADDLKKLDLIQILESRLTWEQRAKLDDWAPAHLTVPSGSHIPLDYSNPAAPVLAVRLQELFGLTKTPRVGGGRVALTLHLLSPAHRPVQVTQDLASFWQDAYFDVKKDLKGRYPKHYWPDDPLDATPTNRAKPRR